MIELASQRYRLGHDYRDTGSVNNPDDQFLGWINLPGSGMRNMGGIRPLKFVSLDDPAPAADRPRDGRTISRVGIEPMGRSRRYSPRADRVLGRCQVRLETDRR